ncbi:MAG: aminotransferase class IV [Bryobacteraceae bacterium]
MHGLILHNDRICAASETTLSAGQAGLLSGWGVFSTIKVIDGVLFAFERHWARMIRDAALLRVPMPSDSAPVHERLLELVDRNHAQNATMRLIVVRNGGSVWAGPVTGRVSDVIAFTAQLKNWGEGVRLAYVPHARHAECVYAGAKILAWAMNLAWLEQAQERGFDEVVLLNNRGEVAECTSANIFVARGNQVWTPPLSAGCLPGVTRDLLLHEVKCGVSVTEKTILPADLQQADEVFITSTTRDLLPVLAIEGIPLRNAGGAREAMQRAFADYVKTYVARATQPIHR